MTHIAPRERKESTSDARTYHMPERETVNENSQEALIKKPLNDANTPESKKPPESTKLPPIKRVKKNSVISVNSELSIRFDDDVDDNELPFRKRMFTQCVFTCKLVCSIICTMVYFTLYYIYYCIVAALILFLVNCDGCFKT